MSVDGGSSHGGSASSVGSQNEASGKETEKETSAFWLGVFGVLYTVSKERQTSWVFFCTKYTLDYVQLTLLLLNSQVGWDWDTNSGLWKFLGILQVQPFMTQMGYLFFVIVMYVFTALLLSNVAICVWTFYSFQNNRFDFVWPIIFLRVFGYIFYQVLDIMSLSLFLTATDCQFWGGDPAQQYYNVEFPAVYCWSMPHLIHFAVGVISLIIFIVLAGAFIGAEMQLNPLTTNKDANAHTSVELTAFAIKAVMTLSQDFVTPRYLAIIWFIGTNVMAYLYWKWEPMVVSWVNWLRVGTYFSVHYCACIFLAMHYPPDSVTGSHDPDALGNWKTTMKYALVGMIPAFGLGMLASHLRLRYFFVTVLNRFRTAPAKAKSRSIYQFSDAREVEILSRCCRKWLDPETLDPQAIVLAERIIKAGLQQLPHSPFMMIWYSSFLIDVQGSYQSGFAQLTVAAKMDHLSYLDKFAIFCREQEHTQKAAGGGTATDLVSFVEFQKNYRLAVKVHRDALLSLRAFWKLLLHTHVRFEDLSRAVRKIDETVNGADRVYAMVLQRHSNSARILRLYAQFLERVKHDPWGSSQWLAEAEKLEKIEEAARHNNLLGLGDADGGGTTGGAQALYSVGANGEERAMVVFNSHGQIQMANSAMSEIFGFEKDEIKGQSMSVLMPTACHEHHKQTIKTFVLIGKGNVVTRHTDFVAMHQAGYSFGAKISVVRISGVGEDSTFLACIERLPTEEGTATVWVLPTGRVLSVDYRFGDWLGYGPADVEGISASNLVATHANQLDIVIKQAKHAMMRLSFRAHMAAQEAAASAEDNIFMDLEAASKAAGAAAAISAAASSMRVTDVVTAALNDAAKPTLPEYEQEGATAEWVLEDVSLRHKFADQLLNVDVKVNNKGGVERTSFCMHVLTLRRCGPSAEQPLPHMLVTNPSGAVLHVTEQLAHTLGATPKELVNPSNSNSVEALMVAPFALLHRSGPGRGGQPPPPGPPPPYSCRAGVSVLMPSVNGPPMPFRMSMKRRVALDDTYHVCTLEQRTWQQALDERSLMVLVDEVGIVRDIGDCRPSLFGFMPGLMVGTSIASFVDVFRGAGGEDASKLLAQMAVRVQEVPGASWRVGVGLDQASKPGKPSQTSKLHPAIMSVVVHEQGGRGYQPPAPVLAASNVEQQQQIVAFRPGSAGGGGGAGLVSGSSNVHIAAAMASTGRCVELRLWRADLVTDVVELDERGIVVEAAPHLQALYPPGLALGSAFSQMLGHHIRNFLPLEGQRYTDLYDEGVFPPVQAGAASSAIKSSFRAPTQVSRVVGPPALLTCRHRWDGMELLLAVQIVRKGNDGSAFLVVHPHAPRVGRLDLRDYMSGRRSRRASQVTQGPGVSGNMPHSTVPMDFHDQYLKAMLEKEAAFGNNASLPIAPAAGRMGSGGASAPLAAHRASSTAATTAPAAAGGAAAAALLVVEPVYPMGADGLQKSPSQSSLLAARNASNAAVLPSAGSIRMWDRDRMHMSTPPLLTNMRSQRRASLAATRSMRSGDSTTDPTLRAPPKGISAAAAGAAGGAPLTLESAPFPRAAKAAADPAAGGSTSTALVSPSSQAAAQHSAPMALQGAGGSHPVRSLSWRDVGAKPRAGHHHHQQQRAPALLSDDFNDDDDLDSEAASKEGSDDGHYRQNEIRPLAYDASGSTSAAAAARKARRRSAIVDDDGSGGDDEGDDEDANFRKGTRRKKLLRMLESEQVQKSTRRFKWHMVAVALLLAVVAIVVYVVTTQQMDTQLANVDDLYQMGQVTRKMMKIAIDTMDLGRLFPGIGHPAVNPYVLPTLPGFSDTVASLAAILKDLGNLVAAMQIAHRGIYKGFDKARQLPPDYGLRDLWESPSVVQFDFLEVTLPSNSTSAPRKYAVELQQSEVSLWDLGNTYMARVSNVIANAFTHNASLNNTEAWAAWVDVQYIVNNSGNSLRQGYLATMDGFAQVVVSDAETVNQHQLIILVLEGVVLAICIAAYVWWLCSKVNDTRFSMYSVFTVVPNGLIRGLANQRLNLAVEGESESDDEAAPAAATAAQPSAPTTPAAGGRAGKMKLAMGANGAKPSASAARGQQLAAEPEGWARLMFWRRGGKVQPLERRRLSRSNRGEMWMCWPFLAWGVLIVVLNAIGYVSLSSVSAPIMLFNSVNFVMVDFWHNNYLIDRLQYEGYGAMTLSTLAELKAELAAGIKEMDKEYTLTLYGQEAFPDETSAHYRLVTDGLSHLSGIAQLLLYDLTDTCTASKAYSKFTVVGCLNVTDVIYQYTVSGVDAAFQHWFEVATQLTMLNGTDPTSRGPELASLWKMRDPILGSGNALVDNYEQQVKDVYTSTQLIQTIAFIVTLVLVVVYMWVLMRPFLGVVSSETRRITELLTQLPVEVDVEALVQRALLSGGTAPPPSSRRHGRSKEGDDGEDSGDDMVGLVLPLTASMGDGSGAPPRKGQGALDSPWGSSVSATRANNNNNNNAQNSRRMSSDSSARWIASAKGGVEMSDRRRNMAVVPLLEDPGSPRGGGNGGSGHSSPTQSPRGSSRHLLPDGVGSSSSGPRQFAALNVARGTN